MENNFNYPIPMTLDEQKVLTKFHDLLNSKKLEYNSKIFCLWWLNTKIVELMIE